MGTTDAVDNGPTTRVVHTACTLDCPDACSLAVTVQGQGSTERLVAVDASPVNAFTGGWICSKVRRHAERVYAPERVLHPLVRTGPKGSSEFRQASWDEALSTIAGRIRGAIDTTGPDAVVAFTYNSSAAAVERNSLTEAFFAAIGATFVDHTICAATVSAAWDSVYADMASADPLDVVESDLIVVWGANPTVSNTHFPPLVREAARRGARLVVIDPRRTAFAKRADLHLAIRPGTDVVLAYAIANTWNAAGAIDREFAGTHATGIDDYLAAASEWSIEAAAEVCGLDARDVQQLCEWWGATRRTMLRIGWGQERNANGGAACRAILALPVLSGGFGERGCGVIGSTSTGAVDGCRRWPEIPTPQRRIVPLHQIGTWMAPGTDDPCSVLFVQGANPALMCPDQHAVAAALTRDDVFIVVHDQVLTDTARFADIVLPATTSFEIDDIATSYGSLMVQPVVAAIAPVGESRSNDAVGLGLANAFGFEWSASPAITASDDAGPRLAPTPSLQFVDTRPDRFDGRARLVDPAHGVPRYVPLPAPTTALRLISPASSKLVNSMFGEFQSPSPAIQVHPDDAAARGLAAGDQVRVFNAQGSITVPLEVNADTRPGVAVMSKGVWLRNYDGGLGVNALTPATGDSLVNGACFNDTLVELAVANP